MKTCRTDVLIVGCGLAGLYTALNLDPKLKCIMLNKAGYDASNSMYAQGGVAAAIGADDNPEKHIKDTLAAGAGLCDENTVKVLVGEAPFNIEQLIRLKVPFDRDKDGKLMLTREGGHSQNRILHSGGDATGFHVTSHLYHEVLKRKNIRIIENVFTLDIITGPNGAAGVTAMDAKGKAWFFNASKLVIASGGIGRVYRNSTNASCITGDGIACAIRAGAEVKDMEFVQFHPTALIHPDNTGRFFLISEALRGEGAVFRNRRWERFMEGVHPLADLAPRDIVSRAIINEMRKHDLPHVYLDITSKPREFLRNRFPTIYTECMRRDIDIAIDWIPVMPVQHYFMGGIKTDLYARTNILNLYACGETTCTGVHGANRLASNSILECLVFGRRCAMDINSSQLKVQDIKNIEINEYEKNGDMDYDSFSTEIRELMTKKCSIIRNEGELLEAEKRINEIYSMADEARLNTRKGFETYNLLLLSKEILKACIRRKKSVGAHFRSDS